MGYLIVGILFVVTFLLVILIGLVGWNIRLTHKTLIRPEAPCYAASMSMMPRVGMVEVDPSNPAYGALSKMIAKKSPAEETKTTGNYL